MGQGFATVSERGILNKYGKGKTLSGRPHAVCAGRTGDGYQEE